MKRNRMILCCSLTLLVLPNINSAIAQNKGFETEAVFGGGEEELMMEAFGYLEIGNYEKAISMFVDLDTRYPGVAAYKYYAGMCYLNKEDEQEKAIEYMEAAYKLPHKTDELPDLAYFLGKSYLATKNYDKASEFFTIAQDPAQKTKKELKDGIELLKLHAQNGKAAMNAKSKSPYQIENLGAPLNTKWGESMPVMSADGNVLAYAYKGSRSKGGLQNEFGEPDQDGKYQGDIYVSYNNGTWSAGKDLGYTVNTNKNDLPLAISADGKTLLVSSDEKKGDINITQLKGKAWSQSAPLPGLVNSKSWEGNGNLSMDGKTLYFSSNRPGGKGGKDLYSATLGVNGVWGSVKNLGEPINSKYDENTPFIHASGDILFFSSTGHTSIGGYDVFYSERKDDQWTKPQNLGMGINSSNDDMYYTVSPDGKSGYFSATRKGGKGKDDIYKVTPGFSGKVPAVAVFSGKVRRLGRFVESNITVTNLKTNEVYTESASSAVNGNYSIGLAPGCKYKLEFKYRERTVNTEIVDLTGLNRFVQIDTDFELDPKTNPKIKLTDVVQKNLDDELAGKTAVLEAERKAEEAAKAQKEADRKAAEADKAKERAEAEATERAEAEARAKEEAESKGNEAEAKEEAEAKVETKPAATQKTETKATTASKTSAKSSTKTTSATSSGSSGKFNTIIFDDNNTGTPVVPKAFKTELNLATIALQANEMVRLQINGYSDNVGSEAENKALSLARANAVANYIMRKGVPKEKLIINAYGSTQPAASNSTAEGRKQNRRVELQMLVELEIPK